MKRQEVIEAIKRIKAWYGGECPPEVLAEHLKTTVEDAIELIREYDAPVVKEENDVKVVKTVVEPKKIVEPVKEVVESKEETKDEYHNIALRILPWASIVIAVLALVRQFMYIFNHFNRLENIVIAGLMAILIGLVSMIVPSVAIASISNKQWGLFIGALLIVGIFGWLNIDITVKEMAHSKIVVDAEVGKEFSNAQQAKDRVKAIDLEIKNYNKLLIDYDKEYNVVLSKSQEIGLKSWEYDRHRNNLAGIKTKIENTTTAISSLNNEKGELTKVDGYYTISEYKESDKTLDIWLAIGLEVIGPMFTIFALYLRRKK